MCLFSKEGYVSVLCLLTLLCVYLRINGCEGCVCDCCCDKVHQPDRPCTLRLCECNPGWNSWGGYGACSATCGGGFETRIRTCDCGSSETQSRSCSNCLNGGTYSGGVCHCEDWQFGSCCTCKQKVVFIISSTTYRLELYVVCWTCTLYLLVHCIYIVLYISRGSWNIYRIYKVNGIYSSS